MTWDLKKTQMEHGPSTSVRKKARPKTSSLTSLLVSTLLIQPTCLTWLLWYSLSSNSRKKQPKSELPNHIPHFHWKGIDVIPADYSWTPYSYGPSPTWLCEPSCWRSRSPRIEALTLSVAGFVNKKLSHSWIIVEHQVKVQKKNSWIWYVVLMLYLMIIIFWSKKNTPCLCSDSLLQNRFPLHPPVQAHKVLLGNRLGGVLCEGFICRLGTLRSRLQALSALTG